LRDKMFCPKREKERRGHVIGATWGVRKKMVWGFEKDKTAKRGSYLIGGLPKVRISKALQKKECVSTKGRKGL